MSGRRRRERTRKPSASGGVPSLGKDAPRGFQALENAAAGRGATPKPTRKKRAAAALAGALLLLAHAPLIALTPGVRAARIVRAPGAALRYLPLPAEAGMDPAVADVRVMWSPALFALPSRAGFSGSTARRPAGAPALEAPNRETALFTPPPPASPAAAVLRPAPRDGVGLPALAFPPVFGTLAEAPAGDRILALDDDVRSALEKAPLDPAGPDAAAWEAWVRIAFDEAGIPRHALIERIEPPETPPAVRVMLQRNARDWRATPGAAREGRFHIRRSAPPPTAGEGGAP